MLVPQTEVEIRIYCDEVARMRMSHDAHDSLGCADDLLHAYRARYGLPQPAADDRLGRAAIEAMDAILKVMGDEDIDEPTLSVIDRIATQYVAARWHIEKEAGK